LQGKSDSSLLSPSVVPPLPTLPSNGAPVRLRKAPLDGWPFLNPGFLGFVSAALRNVPLFSPFFSNGGLRSLFEDSLVQMFFVSFSGEKVFAFGESACSCYERWYAPPSICPFFFTLFGAVFFLSMGLVLLPEGSQDEALSSSLMVCLEMLFYSLSNSWTLLERLCCLFLVFWFNWLSPPFPFDKV